MARMTKAEQAAQEKEARAASMFNQADRVADLLAQVEKGVLTEDELETMLQAGEHAKIKGPF